MIMKEKQKERRRLTPFASNVQFFVVQNLKPRQKLYYYLFIKSINNTNNPLFHNNY